MVVGDPVERFDYWMGRLVHRCAGRSVFVDPDSEVGGPTPSTSKGVLAVEALGYGLDLVGRGSYRDPGGSRRLEGRLDP